MTEQPRKIYVVAQWVEKAESDFISAKDLINLSQNCPYDSVCFHSQQCVEKYIKALLVQHEIEFPKTHDITKLIRLLPAEYNMPLADSEKEKLTDYSISGRYPVDFMNDLTKQDAELAVQLAEKTRDCVRNILSKF